jgi:hypothetical protein
MLTRRHQAGLKTFFEVAPVLAGDACCNSDRSTDFLYY